MILSSEFRHKNGEVEEMRTTRPVTRLLKLIPSLPPTRNFKEALLNTYSAKGKD